MAVLAVNFDRWRNGLRERVPPAVLALFEGGSRHELLKQLDCVFLIFNDRVTNLANGATAQLDNSGIGSTTELARACASLVENGTEVSALLLLPSIEFAATSVTLPNLSREALISVLRLQTDSLLPGINEKLTVAVNAASNSGRSQHVALWMTTSRLDELHAEFAKCGISLSAIMPRAVLLLPATGTAIVRESDASTITRITIDNGCISEWLQVNKIDLQHELFLRQWQQAEERVKDETVIQSESDSDFHQSGFDNAVKEYCFFPRAALNAELKVEKGKRLVMAGFAALILVFLGTIPFLLQSLEFRSLTANLEATKEFSAGPREDRATVQDFENTWGPVSDFPEQRVQEALFTLQNILSPDRLSSFEISNGLISIEGESVEPQAILQRLEQDPMFTEVAFSRATSNSRYYIDLRLSAVNFEGYMVRYFPDN
ncbi:MAG: hypothetical protein WD772_07670 [Pseudohongiellaceae bacterium]